MRGEVYFILLKILLLIFRRIAELTEEQRNALRLQNPTAFCSAFEMVLTSDEKNIRVIRDSEELKKNPLK